MSRTAPAPAAAANDPLRDALRAHFGFDDFHKGQRAVIEDLLAGHPTVAVMPTGAGKSLCYQLPGLLLDGVTVVVSPLIALMKDQVDALRARGVAAEYINSSLDPDAQRAALDRLASGATRLVYVAPERFRSGAFIRALQQVPLALFAVDEAHCISRWGHDFRPDYTRLGAVVERLRPPRLLACTATATPDVRDDMLRALHLDTAQVHVAGFLRDNLYLEARLCANERDREKRLVHFLTRGAGQSGAVIVYASTRKRVERYAAVAWKALGDGQVVAYHGGMDDAERSAAQEAFMSGRARVAVATNAFGMGVDRADVRAVVHVDLPRTLEGYYQEVGRAGRDRQPARCLLLYNPIDTRVHHFLIDQSHPDPKALQAAWHALRTRGPATPRQLAEAVEALDGANQAETVLRHLAKVDAAQFDGGGAFRAHPDAPPDVADLGLDLAGIARHRDHEHDKLRQMKRFVHEAGCRHAYVLRYFGEHVDAACPGCDRCDPDDDNAAPGVVFAPPDDDEALLIRKALAGVARAEGRYGLRKVAAMLVGSRASTLRGTGLDALSTFGLLKDVGLDCTVELLQLLIDQDLARMTGGDYPLLQITEAGWEVMQGRACPGFKPPPHLMPGSTVARRVDRMRKGAASEADIDAEDVPLVDALRAWRADHARERGVPAYVVFSDRTLFAVVDRRPTDERSFLAVHGLGPSKWETFGPDLLQVVAPFAAG
jgi:ATP-dependent DNA helicase RecQ